MDLIKKASGLILAPQCVEKYFEEFDFLDGTCFKSTLSKCLGLALISLSLLVKLPQIIKITKNKSGEGINLFSVMLELTAISIIGSYSFVRGFPFSAWGDMVFMTAQTLIICLLVLKYSKRTTEAFMLPIVYGLIIFILVGGITPVKVLQSLQVLNIPILLTGKSMQAYTNYKNGHTGQLSAITVTIMFCGALAKLFITIQETGDSLMTFVVGSFANTVIFIQLLYYWNVNISEKKKQ